MADDKKLKVSIQVETDEAGNNVSRLKAKYNEMVLEIKKPLGQIDAFSALRKEVLETQRALRDAQTRVKELAREVKSSESKTGDLKTGFEKAKDEVEAAKARVKELATEIQTSKSKSDDLKTGFEKAKDEVKAAKDRVRELSGELQASETKTRELKGNFSKAKDEVKSLTDTSARQREEIGKLKSSLQAAGVDTSKLVTEKVKLEKALKDTTAAFRGEAAVANARDDLGLKSHQSLRQEIDRLKASYITLKSSGTLSMTELAQAKLRLGDRIRELGEQQNGWVTSIEKAKVAAASFVGTLLLIRGVTSAFSDFGQKMAEVNTLLNLSEKDYGTLKETILDLSTRIPQSAEGLAAAAYDLVSSGVALKDLPTALELSAKAAIAGVTDTKTAVNAGMGVINAYGKQMGELGNVYDVLFQVVKDGVTTFPELAHHIGDVLPIARAAGVDITEVGAAIGQLTKAGIRTPQAVTALKGAIQQLSMPTGEAKKEMNALGITWEGLIKTLSKIKSLNLDNETLRKIIPDVEGLTGVLSLTQNYEGLIEILGHVKDAAGSTEEAYGIMDKTPASKVQLLENAFFRLKEALGADVNPVVGEVTRSITDLLNSLANLAKVKPGLTGLFLALITGVASLGALRLAGSTLFLVFGQGVGVLAHVKNGLTLAFQSAVPLLTTIQNGVPTLSRFRASLLALGSVLIVAFTFDRLSELAKLFGEYVELQKGIDKVSAAYKKSAEEFEAYKDTKIKGFDELKAKSADALQAEYENLQKTFSYWNRYQQALEVKSQERSLGGLFKTEEAEAAEKELEGVNAKIGEITKGFGDVGRAAKENNVTLVDFREKAAAAGDSAAAAGDKAKKGGKDTEAANKAAKEAVEALGKEFDSAGREMANAYDFAAQQAKALASDEKTGAQAALEIYRQKADTLIGEANREYATKLAVLQKEGADEKTYTETAKLLARELRSARISALEDYRSKLQQTYMEAISEENRLKEKVQSITSEIASSRSSLEDRTREMSRRTMTDLEAWTDRQKEAYEDLDKAVSALSQAKTPEAYADVAKQFQEAQREAESLVTEVKDGDKTLVSMTEGYNAFVQIAQQAQSGFEQAKQSESEATQQQIQGVQEKGAAALAELEKVTAKINEINATPIEPTARINVDSAEIDAKLAEIQQDTSSIHTIHVQTVEENHTGGRIGKLHSGGAASSLPGVSSALVPLKSNERLSKLLVDEYVFRPEVTKKWGSLLDTINSGKLSPGEFVRRLLKKYMPDLDLGSIPSFHVGGALAAVLPRVSFSPVDLFGDIRLPEIPSFHEGGAIAAAGPGSGETITLRLQAGGVELPVSVSGRNPRGQVAELVAELEKLRLTRGSR